MEDGHFDVVYERKSKNVGLRTHVFFSHSQLTYHSDKMHCLCMGETVVCREKHKCLHKRKGESWCNKVVDQPGDHRMKPPCSSIYSKRST